MVQFLTEDEFHKFLDRMGESWVEQQLQESYFASPWKELAHKWRDRMRAERKVAADARDEAHRQEELAVARAINRIQVISVVVSAVGGAIAWEWLKAVYKWAAQ